MIATLLFAVFIITMMLGVPIGASLGLAGAAAIALANAEARFPSLRYEPDLRAALGGADVVLLLTEWQEYRDLDPVAVAEWAAGPRLLDGRNVLDGAAWRAAGWSFRGMGREHG